MSYGQQGSQSQWDPWKPHSQQPDGKGDTETPDWAALAEASEARNRRRRLLFIGGGVLATVVVGAAVAAAVVSANGGGDTAGPGTSGLPTTAPPSGSATAPSFAPTSAPPPLDPKDFLSSAAKDTAPLGPDTLFPDTKVTLNGAVYQKGPTADTKNCASAGKGSLGKVLTNNHCTRLMRATYTTDGILISVGVAVFDTEAQASEAKSQADTRSIIAPLPGKGVKGFCDGAFCRSTTNSYGRYAYFTLAGFPGDKNVTPKDTEVFRAGDDLAEYAFRRIRARGEAQASAAATS